MQTRLYPVEPARADDTHDSKLERYWSKRLREEGVPHSVEHRDGYDMLVDGNVRVEIKPLGAQFVQAAVQRLGVMRTTMARYLIFSGYPEGRHRVYVVHAGRAYLAFDSVLHHRFFSPFARVKGVRRWTLGEYFQWRLRAALEATQ